MSLLEEYKLSLKELDAEDTLDIFFYRPLAFILVKTFYNAPITPNDYSLLSLLSGLVAGIFFYQGTITHFKWGAIFFLLSSVLDNCDGMVARLKKNGTEFGRLIDGLVDYLVNIVVYISMAIGLAKIAPDESTLTWVFVLLAGLSKAAHSITYDHYLNEYMSYKNGSNSFLTNEINKIKKNIVKSDENSESLLRNMALQIYLKYSLIQAGYQEKTLTFDSDNYCKKNLKLLKLWSLLGPTSHITVLIVACLFGIPFLLFGYSILFGNLWLITMLFIQNRTNNSL